jgi:6-phosphofructokinase 2
MCTIVTVTLSPCIDKSFSIRELVPEKKMRASILKTEPGGGGINVARVLTRLGANVVALYPSGGYTGKALDQLMAKEQIPVLSVETQNETRESIIALETSTNKQFRFTMPAPHLYELELERILERLEEIGKLDFIVVSGSLPTNIPSNIFSQINRIAEKKKARLIVDTSGEALKHAVDHGVYLIKPNMSELAHLAQKEHLSGDEIVPQARHIIKTKKCEIIVVSLNAAGAMVVTNNKAIAVTPPAVKVKSTVGAGDSMVAGIVFSLSKGNDIETAARYGVACGTAATLNAGTELCHKKDVEMLFDQTRSLSGEAVMR